MSPKQKEEKWRQKRGEHETSGLLLHPLLSPTVSWSCGLEFESSLSESIVTGGEASVEENSVKFGGRAKRPPSTLGHRSDGRRKAWFQSCPVSLLLLPRKFLSPGFPHLVIAQVPLTRVFLLLPKTQGPQVHKEMSLKMGKHVFSYHRNCLTHGFA